MTEYYTPQQIAYFISEEEISLNSCGKIINHIYLTEYPFIDSKYKENKQLFQKETLYYINFLTFGVELDKEINKDKMNNDYLRKYEKFIKNFSPNFFLYTRLYLTYNKKFRIIKLRTLLGFYGYKKKTSYILSVFHDNLLFYHLKTYHKKNLKDISEFGLDEWITIKLY